MDDEEYSYAALQESLYRVETGNYEYRCSMTLDTVMYRCVLSLLTSLTGELWWFEALRA